VATTVEPLNDLLPGIEAAQDADQLAIDMKNNIGYPGLSIAREQDQSMNKDLDMQWKVIVGALTNGGRAYVPESLRTQVISLFHDNP